MTTLVVRMSVDESVDPARVDPLDFAEFLMALYDEERKHAFHGPELEADLGAEFLEAEWEG